VIGLRKSQHRFKEQAMRSGSAYSEVVLARDPSLEGPVGEAERRRFSEPVSGPQVVREPLLAGDNQRVACLLKAHFREVWRVVRRFGVPEAGADDAAQEVFIVASRRLADIEPGRERQFLLAAAVRVAANARRSLASRRETADLETVHARVDPAPNAEALLEQKRFRELLDHLLDALSDDLRVAFVLYELEGTSVPEIAELLAIPVGTAASRLRRARAGFAAQVAQLKAARAAQEEA
jgi:RNA polymerase sigma-70 factor (ECF subfamily)